MINYRQICVLYLYMYTVLFKLISIISYLLVKTDAATTTTVSYERRYENANDITI